MVLHRNASSVLHWDKSKYYSSLQGNGQVYSGDYLMKVGLGVFTGNQLNSRVIEISAEN